MKDYYYILGLTSNASSKDIRDAFRKLSLKFHPDMNKGDKFFEDRFKDVNEANDVLSDSEKRKTYDFQFQNFNQGRRANSTPNDAETKKREEDLAKQRRAFEEERLRFEKEKREQAFKAQQEAESVRVEKEKRDQTFKAQQESERIRFENEKFRKAAAEKRQAENINFDSQKNSATATQTNYLKTNYGVGIGGVLLISSVIVLFFVLIAMNQSKGTQTYYTQQVTLAERPNNSEINKPLEINTPPSITRNFDFEPEMVFVKGGTFQMGSNDYDNEKPIHDVTLNDYYIGKYELTQAQWKGLMGYNPSYFKGDDLPIAVSWNDAQEFVQKLNSKTGKNYRLPTEAEWEFAARGGTKSKNFVYSGSDDLKSVAWCEENAEHKIHPVGKLQANELGIYDMSGNVLEWCNDWYNENYYKNSPLSNPQGAASGLLRVARGGNIFTFNCHVSKRLSIGASQDNGMGFRLVLSSLH